MQMLLSRLARTSFFCVLLIISSCSSEKMIALKFNPQQDKKYKLVMSMDQDIEMEQSGIKQTGKNLIEFTYEMAVKPRDAKQNVVMATTFKKIKFSSKMAGMEINYDSEKPGGEEGMFSQVFAKVFGGMIGKTVNVTVDQKGEVVSLTGMEDIFKSMIKDMNLDSLPGGAAMVENMRAQYTDEKFKASFENMFRILPDHEVQVGDEWEINNRSEIMGMALDSKAKYKLKDIDKKTADVTTTSDIAIDKGASGIGGMAMKMTGTQKGTMKVDLASGMPLEADITQDISASTTAGGSEMPMKIKGLMKLRSREL